MACRAAVRQDRQQRDGAHHRRPQHAGRRLHDDDERHQRQRGQRDRDPRADQPRGEAAPPRRRSSRWRPTPPSDASARPSGTARWSRRVTAEVSPSTSAGSIAAWSAGSASRAAAANRPRTACAARCIGAASPSVGSPVADQHRDGQVAAGRPGDRASERGRLARGQLGEAGGTARKPLPGRTFRRTPTVCSDRAEHHPAAAQRPRRFARRDGDGHATVPNRSAIGWWSRVVDAERIATREARARDADRHRPAAGHPRTPGLPPAACASPPPRPPSRRSPPASAATTPMPATECRPRSPPSSSAPPAPGAGRPVRGSRRRRTVVTPEPGLAACPAAPDRCRRHRRVGRRW